MSLFDGKTALLVDDSPDTLSFLNDALEPTGITVLLALDGEQALTIASRMAPDIILLDAIMPNLDGFETCLALKADTLLAQVPVVFMTGLSDTDSVVRGLAVGGVDYLTKPVNSLELIARIEVHLGIADEARNVRQALDRTGQRLVSLDAQGRELWISDQAVELLVNKGATTPVARARVYMEIQRWRGHRPESGQTLHVTSLKQNLDAILLSQANEAESLIRLVDPSDKPSAIHLQAVLPVTGRESEVLFWVANGKTNREIAEILSMSPRTVNKHLETIFPKLGVENRTSAAAIAIRVLETSI
ncbi:MAG: response regulator [Pseudomonadales bacterium]|nr:response regulator [Pseudomonadales bacterium]